MAIMASTFRWYALHVQLDAQHVLSTSLGKCLEQVQVLHRHTIKTISTALEILSVDTHCDATHAYQGILIFKDLAMKILNA